MKPPLLAGLEFLKKFRKTDQELPIQAAAMLLVMTVEDPMERRREAANLAPKGKRVVESSKVVLQQL